jgi:2,3-bisphosphoglycerate-dependent phosphoglycerate mutase
LTVQIENDLRERTLGDFPNEDFFGAVEATWQDPMFAHPGGETNASAQQRGLSVIRRLRKQHEGEQIVLSTHGNLLALMMQGYDPSIDFTFWKSLSLPDIYALSFIEGRNVRIKRIWDK